MQTLRRWNLDAAYRGSPTAAFARLQDVAEKDPELELVFALAEISYLLAAVQGRLPRSMAYYYPAPVMPTTTCSLAMALRNWCVPAPPAPPRG